MANSNCYDKLLKFVEIDSSNFDIPNHRTYQHVKNEDMLLIFREKEFIFFDARKEEEVMRFPLLVGEINEEGLTRRIEYYWHSHEPCKQCITNDWPEDLICRKRKNIFCRRRLLVDFLRTEDVVFSEDRDFQEYRDLIYNHPVFDALRKKYLYHSYLNDFFQGADSSYTLIELVKTAARWLNVCISDEMRRTVLFASPKSVFDPVEDEVDRIFFSPAWPGDILEYFEPDKVARSGVEIDSINKICNTMLNDGKKWYFSRRYNSSQSAKLAGYRFKKRLYFGVKYPWLLFAPRLLGAILVGYLPIFVTSEVWKGTCNLIDKLYTASNDKAFYLFAYCLFIIIPLIITFGYMRIEVGNYVEKVISMDLWRRSGIIICQGYVSSFVVGYILCYVLKDMIFADSLYVTMKQTTYIMPSAFLWSSVALCIGLFLQILWEDKPITEPL